MKKSLLSSVGLLAAGALAVVLAASLSAPPTTSLSAVQVAAAADPAEFVILTVGDSISLSQSNPDSYRTELGRLLGLAGVNYRFVVAANGGWTCADWVPLAQQLAATNHPNLVIIECGTNDSVSPVGANIDSNYFNLMTNFLIGWPTTKILPSWIQYSAQRTGLPGGEANINDAIYRQTINSVHGTRLIFPPADFQQIPEEYLDGGGIHPTAAGWTAMGRIAYNAMRSTYGLADVAPPMCGMTGHRPGGNVPAYIPCTTLAGA